MKMQCDVIIVGGGVIGHSIAYSLSKRGIYSTVIEKGRANEKATSAAAGMLGVQSELKEDGPLFELARRSRNMFPQLQEELLDQTGIDIELIQEGMLTIAKTEEETTTLKSMVEFQNCKGEQAQWLTSEGIREMEPNLSDSILGALYAPKDGQVSAYKLGTAFAKAASSLGVELLEYTEVTSLIMKNGRILGVKTTGGDFLANHVVVAGGAWSNNVLQSEELNLPIYPVKGECFSVISEETVVTRTIFSDECYIVPKTKGRYFVGATMIPHTFDESVSVVGISNLLKDSIKIIPKLIECKWEKVWAGIRPQTGDGLPFLGEHPFIQGLYVAGGHYRNGILLSPITGEVVANLIEGQEQKHLLHDAFSLDVRKREEYRHEAMY